MKKESTSLPKSRPCTHRSGPELLETAWATMKRAGLKQTAPREKLLKRMVGFHHPFSADDLFRKGKTKESGFDLVTIYRTLTTLNEIGVLDRVDLGDGVLRYELRDPSGHHHHHVVCTKCGRIDALDLCLIDQEEKRLKGLGYGQLTHRLEFQGICPSCNPASL